MEMRHLYPSFLFCAIFIALKKIIIPRTRLDMFWPRVGSCPSCFLKGSAVDEFFGHCARLEALGGTHHSWRILAHVYVVDCMCQRFNRLATSERKAQEYKLP